MGKKGGRENEVMKREKSGARRSRVCSSWLKSPTCPVSVTTAVSCISSTSRTLTAFHTRPEVEGSPIAPREGTRWTQVPLQLLPLG
jgi:hypothetical protein